jgi:alginate O-acetyltransferase complex protein AlgI
MNTVAENRPIPTLTELLNMTTTFGLVMFGWIFFRASSISDALYYIKRLFSVSLFSIPDFPHRYDAFFVIIYILIFLVLEWIGKRNDYAIKNFFTGSSRPVRWAFYYFIVFTIIWVGNFSDNSFIYFQF